MAEEVDFIIVTGMSGAGKSEAINVLEDLGYFCVDNLPPALISKFAELCSHSNDKVKDSALVIDIRGRDFFDSLFEELSKLETAGFNYRILFLEAATDVLINRFKKTRRRHPLAPEGRISEAINLERNKLEKIRGAADKIIDTTELNPKELKKEIEGSFVKNTKKDQITLSILSFGFKYGVPLDADLMFDVRFLPNPHYVDSLRPLTGEDKRVQDYVLKWPITKKFKHKLFDMIDFLLPQYIKEGKTHLTIAIGCTGGHHRSVTLVEKLYEEFKDEYNVLIKHRDSDK
ncbi:putative P-loop-containing kinase [Halobacteroides halobius DSM 5150]|uniref:Putative P-loop-containing kinase n=1 Tax=Halobacteroides halobius (strain ATCC 35273 / DSM 5150 / MD-1) TaxID=748449 RepID=L0KD37_HALHC|nr:RNase adapter RapZ [Halobacteroides halobius]AGB41998.1 putative P-loop-containing kinase [Halobacteroides halobius DSM 5150]